MLFKVTILAIIGLGYGAVFPSGIPKCKIEDENCLITVINGVIQGKFEGISALGLPNVDPLAIDQLNIVQGGGSSQIKLDIILKDVRMSGISKGLYYKVNGFKNDPEGNKLETKIKIPLLQILSTYKANGQILILPIQGNGQANLTLGKIYYSHDIHHS
ncbi:unnamed protein product [Diamesa serratosioi]